MVDSTIYGHETGTANPSVINGIPQAVPPSKDKSSINKVAERSAAVQGMYEAWSLIKTLMGGTYAMRAAGQAMLPMWPKEDPVAYANRLSTATLFPALKKTIKTLTGKPFSKPVTFSKDPSDQIKKWTENIDLQGRNLHVFSSEIVETCLAYGMTGILVDVPHIENTSDRILTQAEETALGIRPYMIQIYPDQILGWKSKRQNGVETLLQLRFMEWITEDDGQFGEQTIEQVKVLEPGKWAIYRKRIEDKKEIWYLQDEGVTTLNMVPFVPVYGNRTGYIQAEPPLLELAHMNVKHYQSQSDQDTILHVARVPILSINGILDDSKGVEVVVGGAGAVALPPGAEMKFVEHTGAGIAAGRTSLEDLKEEMRQAGAELLVLKPGKITATQVGVEQAVGMSDLQRIINGAQDSLNQALAIMGLWVKDTNTGACHIFNDFGAFYLSDTSVADLIAMTQAGYLSKETLLQEVQRRGTISPDVDLQEEADRIATDGPPLGTVNKVSLPITGTNGT